MSGGWRWPVARFLDRSRWFCWADLVGWAQRTDGCSLRERKGNGVNCAYESVLHRDRTCYCGKFRNGGMSSSVASTEVKP
jgi:hypothetical protein